ncbi:unnamed protein product [Diatraea saccharalis]|uniref:Tetraspanin n=1 Tax=Diatraea saccharalis TaxID=40085 RepID=A0A9N9QUE1_9NEOP|nr:unnamed protein product [Diatraea saccharalis]
MGCGTSFVKYVLFFFNLVVALLGLAVVGIGVAFLVNWRTVKDELQAHLTVAPWVFIIIGAIMFVIAFFGCCGAIRESHCMVVTYAIFLLVIIIMQVILAVLLFVYGDTIKTGLEKGVDGLWNKRASDGTASEVFNNIQAQLQCCGNNGPGDYYSAVLDKSCCNYDAFGSQVVGCTVATANPGCRKRIGELYENWNKPIAGVAIGVACIEVVGALFALCLANSIRNMDRRSHY